MRGGGGRLKMDELGEEAVGVDGGVDMKLLRDDVGERGVPDGDDAVLAAGTTSG